MKHTRKVDYSANFWKHRVVWTLAIGLLVLAPLSALAATASKTYTYTGSSESWAGVTGTDTTTAYSANTLTTTISGRKKANLGVGWEISGVTWESLGVPAGSTVTAVDGAFDWWCSTYTVGDQSSSGNLTLTDAADGNATTLETEVLFTSTTTQATRNASGAIAVPAAIQASDSSLKIKLLGDLGLGNDAGASITRVNDNVDLTITYTAPTPGNTYGTMTSLLGPLSADGSQQAVATVPVTQILGGASVSSYTVNLGGTVAAGDVTGVYVTDGTNTWSATGSYGNGSSVICTGANAIPGGLLAIRVTLNGTADAKTVAVTLQTDSNAATSLPKGPSNALAINGPSNSYGAMTSEAGPLTADLSQQTVATVPVTNNLGGRTVSSYTVNISGTVTAGDVAGVYVTDGTNTWSATGSYGNGSSVVCSGTNAIPGATLSIRVTLNNTADTKTVAVTLQTDSNAASTLPKGPSTALTCSAPVGPSDSLADCAGCHNYPPGDAVSRDGATGNFIGDHDKHSAYTCATCHVTPATQTATDFAHRTGNLDLDSGNIGVGADNGTYSKGATFAQSNSPTTGTCSLVDCHNNAVTPQWGVGTTACNTCHTLPPATNAHAAHYTAKGWAADNANCTVCHPDNTAGHSDVTDNSVTVIAGLTPAGTSPAITCATTGTGCHNEKTTPAWNTANIACTSCHTAGGAAAGDPTTGLHATTNLTDHDGTLTGGTGNPCEKCHTASPSNLHFNGTVNNAATATFAWDTSNIPAGYNRTNDFCAAVCHTDSASWNREWSGATDAAWAYANDAATTAVCGNCHGSFFTGWNIIGSTSHDNPDVDNDPDTLATSKGSHSECSACHAWGHNNYTTGTKHENNLLEMNSTLDTTPGDGNCTTNCHSPLTLTMDGNSGWTDASVAGDGVTCSSCHTGGVTPGSASGAHTAHGATAASVAANPASVDLCIECHGNNGTGVSHNNGTVNFVGATYSTAVRNDLTGTCSTTSCHNTGAEQSAAWNSAALACDDCHYYAATPTAAGNTAHDAPLSAAHGDHFSGGKVCTQCHGTLPTDTTHINGATSNADKATATQDEAGIDFTDASAVTDYTWTDGSNTCSGGTNNGLGCHATGTAVWDTPFASTACITCHTDTSTAAVNPTSGLHGVTPSISAEQHDSSFDGGSGNCSSCHTTIPAYTTHKDGTFAGGNGQTTQMGLATFYTQTANDTGTCATTTCHLGNSDAWAHKWMATANYTNATASCTGCHGNLSSGWNAGVDHLTGGIAGDHADDGTASNYGCEACHALQASTGVYPFTFGTADWAPLNAGNKHGNNLITMNDNGTGTISDWQRGTGGNSTKSMCLKCHTTWTDSAPQHWFTNTTWTPEEIAGDGISAGHGAGAACISCHDGQTQGTRRDVGLEFNMTRQHGSNNPTSADCEQCHEESSGPDGTVQLKVWNADNSTFTTATYDSANLASANTHCLSCHDATRGLTISGLSAPARSMANYTSATTYNNHNFTTVTGAVVPQKAKAISPHGNPNGNQMKATESSVTTAVGCLHCHPSHGSGVVSKTATADATGAALTAKMLGGFPSSATSVGYDYTNEGTLADPQLCWGCHDNKGVADYYGDTTTGHWNTGGVWKSPTFAYKTGKGGVLSVHVADKADGGTADNAIGNVVCTTCHDVHGSPTVAQFWSPALKGRWLTSPYYEDRAPPSKTSTTNGLRLWANADSTARSANDGYSPRAAIETGTAWAPKEVGGGYGVVGAQNGAWGWFIDGNTFGMSAYRPYDGGAVTQLYMSNFDATAANISTFGGLCMTACHTAANIETRLAWTGHNPVVPGFGGGDAATDLFNVNGTTNPATAAKVRNQMVGQGWYNNGDWGQNLFATGTGGERQGGDGGTIDGKTYSHSKAFSYGVNPVSAGAQANYHQFSCSKCHTPHASVLPALMRTNCLNTAQAGMEWRMAAEANNCHRVETTGGYIGAGDPYPGTGYPATHGGATNGGWNAVTPW